MFQLLELIGSFFSNFYEGISTLFGMFVDIYGLFYSAFLYAPAFLMPILYGMIAVVVIMWLVNLL